MRTKKIVVVLLILFICLGVHVKGVKGEEILEVPLTRRYWLPIPMAIKDSSTPDARFGIQLGWWHKRRVSSYQEALNLANTGGDAHLLEPENQMQMVQTEEWFEWYNGKYGRSRGDISPHVLSYSATERTFKHSAEAMAWIRANPGKTYLVGNEPDGPLNTGGHEMTEEEFAEFYYKASMLIRESDPTAFIVVGAWAGGIAEPGYRPHNENNMLRYYFEKYGQLDADALSWHYYQSKYYNNPDATSKLNNFAEYARLWKEKGWTNTDKIALTEFGWYGPDVNNTPINCILFLEWFIPYLKDCDQCIFWYWWEWGRSATLVRNGVPTEVGLYYSRLANDLTREGKPNYDPINLPAPGNSSPHPR